MALWGRLLILGGCAALAVLGLALGAESQREFVLESDLEAQGEIAAEGAAGNLVILTGLLVGLGAAAGVALLSRRPVPQRLAPAGLLFLAAYGGTLLLQTMWPYYVAIVEQRQATLTNSPILANLPATPSVLLPPMALALAALLAGGAATARLLGVPGLAAEPRAWLRAQAAAMLLAVPFLAVAAWGNLRLLLALPDDPPGLGPYLLLLPALTLGCLALAAAAVAKTWQLGTYVRNARLAAATSESWQALGRAELTVASLLAALALAATFLPAVAMDELAAGRVFVVTLRGHTQLMVLLAIPLAPGLLLHARIARRLAQAPVHAATLEGGPDALAVLAGGAAVAGAALAGLGTFAIGPAVWAWLLAFLPGAAVAGWRCGPRHAAAPALLVAAALWGAGNTVQATYAGGEASVLSFVTPPGLLALWRTLAALVAAATLARLANRLAPGAVRARAAAVGAGAAAAAVALLEVPLTAWLLNRPGVDAIAVGSVVASLDAPVRSILHTVAVVFGVSAALLAAWLHRPDWFGRRPRDPVAAIRPKGAKGRAGTAKAPA